MTTIGSFASLSPSLLARKGGAKPAMRRQFQPVEQFEAEAAQVVANEDDLGWNDMGERAQAQAPETHHEAEVVPIIAAPAIAPHAVPEVVRQQAALPERIAAVDSRPRRSALAEGRKAAFTLRLDAARHLDLRLACTLTNRSAQQLLIEALDRMLADMPQVGDLAAQVRKQR
jgi:hypothetical protein